MNPSKRPKIEDQFYKHNKDHNDKIFSEYSTLNPSKIRKLKNLVFGQIEPLIRDNIGTKEISSEHYDFFNCLRTSGRNFDNILEIGTFKGYTTAYLAILFPSARVFSIDLPISSHDYINTYDRSNGLSEFVAKRNSLLTSYANIRFLDKPSTSFLFNYNQKKFDLIWIDVDHSYPQVCIDIVKSLQLLSDNGVIMVDDIYRFGHKLPENHLKSVAAFETIENLALSQVINRQYIYKRCNLKSPSNVNHTFTDLHYIKSIAIITKCSSDQVNSSVVED